MSGGPCSLLINLGGALVAGELRPCGRRRFGRKSPDPSPLASTLCGDPRQLPGANLVGGRGVAQRQGGATCHLKEEAEVTLLCAGVAVWHCPYPVYSACCVVLLLSSVQGLLCGIAPILFTARLACCVVLLLSYVQGLLCGIAPILLTALAVWFCFYLMCRGYCVALPLSC